MASKRKETAKDAGRAPQPQHKKAKKDPMAEQFNEIIASWEAVARPEKLNTGVGRTDGTDVRNRRAKRAGGTGGRVGRDGADRTGGRNGHAERTRRTGGTLHVSFVLVPVLCYYVLPACNACTVSVSCPAIPSS